MSEPTVLISGAGIAGPALACWLRRAGYAPTVVEVAPGVRPGGQTVDLRGAGRTVIERLGLMGQARELCLDQRGLAYVDATGRHRAEMTVEDFDGDGIISELEILRGDLAGLLYRSSAAETTYVFGRRITALTDHGDAVEATFDDGSRGTYDLVVGADGPHSGVRRLAFGPEEKFDRPLGGYNAWFTAPATGALAELDGWYLMYNEPGGLVASVRPDSDPDRVKAGLSFVSAPLRYDRSDLAAQRELIAERFTHVGWLTPALVAAARTADDFYFDAFQQIHLDRWSSGRIVLLGDAGWCPSPLTGMGTSLALVGAYVLAGELARTGGDHVRAFDRYETVLRPYVRQGQQLPPGGIKGYAPATRTAIAMRSFSGRMMVRPPFRQLAKRLFFSAAEAIDLPDYDLPVHSRRP